jgi:FkbM family methyltransferase
MIKRLLGDLLRKAGYQAVPKAILRELGLVLHLRELFQSQRIDAVFDVGANCGQFYRLVRNHAQFKGTVLSFEPIPELHRALSDMSRADPKWHVFPFALGVADEKLTINVMKVDSLSSFLAPDLDYTQYFRNVNKPQRQELVHVKRLDDICAGLCREYSVERPYLKLDTQGYDLNVLKGGTASLERFVALQTEASVLALYKDMPNWRQVIDYLGGVGFELSGVFPVSTDEHMRLIEFDCIMINPTRALAVPAPLGRGPQATLGTGW